MVYREVENDSAARSGTIANEENFSDITDRHEIDPFYEPSNILKVSLNQEQLSLEGTT
jgi:hypothetical protein